MNIEQPNKCKLYLIQLSATTLKDAHHSALVNTITLINKYNNLHSTKFLLYPTDDTPLAFHYTHS